MAEYALRLDNGADTRDRVRKADALALQPAGPLTARAGVRRDTGAEVSVVEGSMLVQVSPFMGWVAGGVSVAQGGYPFVLDDTKTLPIADGDANATRTDTVAAVVYDDDYDGSGTTEAAVVVVQGIPGAGAPALPATALPLRHVEVPPGVSTGTGGLSSSNLGSDLRTYLSSGIASVSGATARDALGDVPGQVVYREDTGQLEVHDGTRWSAVYPSDLQNIILVDATAVNTVDPRDILSLTVDCPGPQAVYLVTATLDTDSDGQQTGVIELYAGDAGRVEGALIKSSPGRVSLTRSWRVSDMPAGPQLLRLAGRRSGPGAITVRGSHTELIVDRRA